jgi:Ser/Thr protein kinase RdoA (MazF antagonist)
MPNDKPGPRTSDVLRALRAHVNVKAHSMRRLPTGLAHYVYEIMTDDAPVIVRMADPAVENGIPGGVYWHGRLKELGVPVPEMYGHDLEAEFPYMVLERLPGSDLGAVYPDLTAEQKRTLAHEIAAIQDRVGTLPHADHFGYLDSYDNPTSPAKSWNQLMADGLNRAEKMIREGGVFDPEIVARVRAAAAPRESYFSSVQPAPFLDDTTTKNVIIHNGALSGIVDTDNVCFGDRLDVLALTNTAVLSRGWEPDYIDYWAEAWELGAAERKLVDLYTAMHGVYFMGEIGQKWNKDEPLEADETYIERLREVVEGLLVK